MTDYDKQCWLDNISEYASLNAEKYGNTAVAMVFSRYDATNIEDLDASFYPDIFFDLYAMYYDV